MKSQAQNQSRRPNVAWSTSVLAVAITLSCRQTAQNAPPPSASTGLVAPDRLAPSEPLIGTERVMGLQVPNGLRIAARYPKSAHLTGQVPLHVVSDALRKQVLTSHVEITPRSALFARVHVRGDVQRRVLRIEAVREKNQTRVHIADITPAPVTEGLDVPERWDRAGRNPDGTVKDRSKVF